MKPYYEHAGITIYHGDCRDVLPQLFVADAVITDPPYLNLDGSYCRDYQGGVGKKRTVTKTVGDPWSASLDWIEIAASKASSALMIFCSMASVGDTWLALRGFGTPIALVTWYKRNSAPTGKNVPYYMTEFIWCQRLGAGPKWDDLPTWLDIPNLNAGCMATERLIGPDLRAVHPTQKPEAVMANLLIDGIRSVIDPFMGSGTTLVAAKRLGRQCVGIEREEKYCEIAVKRLSQEALPLEMIS